MNVFPRWFLGLLFLGVLFLSFCLGVWYGKTKVSYTDTTTSQGIHIKYTPAAYYFSDIAADAPGRLDKLTFHQNGTYEEMIDFIGKNNATSSIAGKWNISGSNLLLTPTTNDGESYTFSVASSTNDMLVAGMETFSTQSLTKQSCEQVANNVWDEALQGCWEEHKVEALLKAYSSAGQ